MFLNVTDSQASQQIKVRFFHYQQKTQDEQNFN